MHWNDIFFAIIHQYNYYGLMQKKQHNSSALAVELP